MPLPENYSHIGKASDLAYEKDRKFYRLLEMLPGFLTWGTIVLAIIFSWLQPVWVAFFMIAFVIYLLLRTLYFAFHLWTGYQHMRINEKKDWMGELEKLPSFKHLYHLVVIPTYRESLEVLRPTLEAIQNSTYPKDKMIVVLGIEEREGEEAQKKADVLKKEFGGQFFKFLITKHPDNIAGEIAGKGSNESFAARVAKEEILDALKIPYENVIISSLDADTVVYPQYFSCLTWYYITIPDAVHTSFQPIPLYLNNIWNVPPISRVFAFSSTFWHTMNQQRPEKLITFSSHAMSFQALVDVNFRAPNVVNDDSHIFWQCFFHYKGNYKVQSLYYPVSMDANAAKNIWTTLKNIYMQHRRWAYGVGEIAYVFFGFAKDKGKTDDEKTELVEKINYASGTCLFTSKIVLDKIGLLDPFLFLYHDDLDLGWRAAHVGINSFYVPKSIIYHAESYSIKWSSKKFYWLERNRKYCLLTHYSKETYAKMRLSLFLVDLCVWLFYLSKGFLGAKIKAELDIFRNRKFIKIRYNQLEKIKIVSDKELIKKFPDEIFVPKNVSEPIFNQLFNSILSALSKKVKKKII